MKITVVTPVFNAASTIASNIESVLRQTYRNVEHIIVDGGSLDATVAVIQRFDGPRLVWISEKDGGIYDAINKGIRMSTGDVVCFLCADDLYANNTVLEKIAEAFEKNRGKDIVYGDIVYVNKHDLTKVERYWKSCPFKPGLFRKGWLPPNTALFIKSAVLKHHELFSLRYKLAADFELQYRLFEQHRLNTLYVPGILVKMRNGGASNASLRSMFNSLRECYAILRHHGVRFPLVYIINTIFYRMKQLFIPSHVHF